MKYLSKDSILKTKPIVVYRKLLKRFGPQGWWPAARKGRSEPEYHPGRYLPLSGAERFEICVGAILTQNTAWKNVEKAISALHRAKLMAPRKIMKAGRGRLAGLVRPTGYYNQKAARLANFAGYVCLKRAGGLKGIFAQPLEAARNELLSLNGIGPETADSMLLYAGGKATFVVDAYTCRLYERIGWGKDPKYGEVKAFFENNLPCGVKLYNEFHALIVALGKEFCRTEPLCGKCPVRTVCKHGKTR